MKGSCSHVSKAATFRPSKAGVSARLVPTNGAVRKRHLSMEESLAEEFLRGKQKMYYFYLIQFRPVSDNKGAQTHSRMPPTSIRSKTSGTRSNRSSEPGSAHRGTTAQGGGHRLCRYDRRGRQRLLSKCQIRHIINVTPPGIRRSRLACPTEAAGSEHHPIPSLSARFWRALLAASERDAAQNSRQGCGSIQSERAR